MDRNERFDSKAVAAAAHGTQFPKEGPLKAGQFSGGDATVRRKLEELGFTVTGPEQSAQETLDPNALSVQAEHARRVDLWSRLIAARGPSDVSAATLNDLKIFYGARGIWVDKTTTAGIGGSSSGVTVALLHTGSAYADDLSEDSVIYHYPQTERNGRDLAEISATKAAATLSLPVRVTGLLDAAHVVGVEHDGSDDPRNGLIFCATHHRAFDADMFAIRPNDLQIISGKRQPSLNALGIDRVSLSLPRPPHIEALRWRWERWKHCPD